ncbi:hypothetical protein ACFE04_027127 [Oxalis oulophora]
MPSETDKWGWEHVSVFGGFDRGSGTKRWKCNHCNLRYNGSYSRVRAHLLGFSGVGVKSCPAIDTSLREAFVILEEERLTRKKKKTPGVTKGSKRARTSQSMVTHKPSSKEDVDDILARFFYAEGLNVNIVNSTYFYEMVKAISAFGSGYEPPPVDKLSNSFLCKEKGRIEKSMTLLRDSWPLTGCTILCVGRLNDTLGCFHVYLFVSSPRGLMFLKTVDLGENDEGENVFSDSLTDAIVEVGPTNVLQIISQLGHVYKSSESLLLSKYPHIFWSPCTSHSIQVLMDAMSELEWIKPAVLCAKGIEQCMNAYHHAFPCPFTLSSKDFSDPISMKFAPFYCFLRGIFELKQVLQDVIVSEEWKQWKLGITENISIVESSIIGDDFWSKVHMLLQIYEPFISLLSAFDIDKSTMGSVYDWRIQALETVRSKQIDDCLLNQLEILIDTKWDVLFSPLHAAGYILNPKYFGNGQNKDKTIMRGWKSTLERYEYDSAARRVLREQLSSYWRLEGSLGEEDALDCRDKMDPVVWWENFGFETPELQTLAIKILSQVSSITMCQEILQGNDFPCRESANRSGVQRMEDLIFVRNNLRLHSQRSNGQTSSTSSQRIVSLHSPTKVSKTWESQNVIKLACAGPFCCSTSLS